MQTDKFDKTVIQDVAKAGIWPCFPPHGITEEHLGGITLPLNMKLNELDFFHRWIIHHETMSAEITSMIGAYYPAIPPVGMFMKNEALSNRVCRETTCGEEMIALA